MPSKRFSIVNYLFSKLDRHSIRLLIFTIASAGMLLVVSYVPITLLAFLGLMPSLVILIMETQRSLPMFRTVAPINVFGIAWVYSHALSLFLNNQINFQDMLRNRDYWLIIFGSCLLGIIIYVTMPHILRGFREFKINSEINVLRRRRSQLRKTWGSNLVKNFVESEAPGSELIDYLLSKGMISDLDEHFQQIHNNTGIETEEIGIEATNGEEENQLSGITTTAQTAEQTGVPFAIEPAAETTAPEPDSNRN